MTPAFFFFPIKLNTHTNTGKYWYQSSTAAALPSSKPSEI